MPPSDHSFGGKSSWTDPEFRERTRSRSAQMHGARIPDTSRVRVLRAVLAGHVDQAVVRLRIRGPMKAATVRQRARKLGLCALWALCLSVSSGCGRVSTEHEGGPGAAAGGNSNSAVNGGSDSATAGQFARGGAGGSGGSAGGQLSNGGASGAEPRDCGALIDDMEDESGHICFGAGRVGVWYSFNDGTLSAVQWPAEAPPGTPIATSLIPGGRGASAHGIHTYGSGFWGWGSGVGVDLNFDGATYHVYDATHYQGVQFWARGGDANGELRFRVGTASTTALKYGGTCGSTLDAECAGPAGTSLKVGAEWRQFTVSFGELGVASERDHLTNIQFMTKGSFDFWIDDVSFVEGEPNCCSKLAACQNGAHIADPAIRSTLKADEVTGALSCDRICDITSLALSNPAIQSLSGLECLSALESLRVQLTAVQD